MTRSRDIANLGDGIATADIGDGQVTAGKLNSTLDLSSKTVTLPSGVGGKVLNVLQATSTARVQISVNSYDDLNPSLAITPSSTSSNILVVASYSIGLFDSSRLCTADIQILRDATSRIEFITAASITAGLSSSPAELRHSGQYSFVYLDSPNTTSSVTYKLQGKNGSGTRMESPSSSGTSQNILTLMEIAG